MIQSRNSEKWLWSYSVFLLLLFALFVVLYATAQQKISKLEGGNLGVKSQSNATNALGAGTTQEDAEDAEFNRMKDVLKESLSIEFGPESFQDKVDIFSDKRGLVLRLRAEAFFERGQAEVRPNATRLLEHLGGVVQSSALPVRVEGHTDNHPVDSELYPSNWELSTARSAWVTRYFIGRYSLNPLRFEVVGFADTRPLYDNDTPEHQALNRRIEIVLQRRQKTPSQ